VSWRSPATARLWVDGLPGNQAGELGQRVGSLTPQGGTNLEDAMNLAYQTRCVISSQWREPPSSFSPTAPRISAMCSPNREEKSRGAPQQGIALIASASAGGVQRRIAEMLSRNGESCCLEVRAALWREDCRHVARVHRACCPARPSTHNRAVRRTPRHSRVLRLKLSGEHAQTFLSSHANRRVPSSRNCRAEERDSKTAGLASARAS